METKRRKSQRQPCSSKTAMGLLEGPLGSMGRGLVATRRAVCKECSTVPQLLQSMPCDPLQKAAGDDVAFLLLLFLFLFHIGRLQRNVIRPQAHDPCGLAQATPFPRSPSACGSFLMLPDASPGEAPLKTTTAGIPRGSRMVRVACWWLLDGCCYAMVTSWGPLG